jgi:hypothetical protein
MPSTTACTAHSAIADTAMPDSTNHSGISPEPIRAVRRSRNVAISRRQRSPSAVSPPATSMPVAGHIPQNSTSVRIGGGSPRGPRRLVPRAQ